MAERRPVFRHENEAVRRKPTRQFCGALIWIINVLFVKLTMFSQKRSGIWQKEHHF
jgi:hypothetical protein